MFVFGLQHHFQACVQALAPFNNVRVLKGSYPAFENNSFCIKCMLSVSQQS